MRALVTLVVLLVMLPAASAGQASPDSGKEWTPEPGGRARVDAGVLTILRGTIRTTRLYSDFVLRFEFRVTEPKAEGSLFVRSRFGYGSGERGYRVALTNTLDGAKGLGRLSGVGVRMREREFTPAQLRSVEGGWQTLELRAERSQITVSANGKLVSSNESLDEFTGYIALQDRRGQGLEFRNIVVERLPSTADPFGRGAYRAGEAGVSRPRALKTAKPFYPKEPHDAWIQGIVGLELVVDVTGRAHDIRITKSLHPELDEAAIGSARQWEFVPGTVSGQVVPVIVTMEVSFRRTR